MVTLHRRGFLLLLLSTLVEEVRVSHEKSPLVHPYIPNSAPAVREEMLRACGLGSTEEIYASIPAHLRLDHSLDLPSPPV